MLTLDHITIYIINLASAEKRRIRMIEQCRLAKLALGEDVEFFTAICGNALSEQQKNCQDFKKQYRKYIFKKCLKHGLGWTERRGKSQNS